MLADLRWHVRGWFNNQIARAIDWWLRAERD